MFLFAHPRADNFFPLPAARNQNSMAASQGAVPQGARRPGFRARSLVSCRPGGAICLRHSRTAATAQRRPFVPVSLACASAEVRRLLTVVWPARCLGRRSEDLVNVSRAPRQESIAQERRPGMEEKVAEDGDRFDRQVEITVNRKTVPNS